MPTDRQAVIGSIDGPTWVYQALCNHGLPLYVGMARDVPRRIAQHRRDKPWWDGDVWAVVADLYGSRDLAADVERKQIKLLHPLRNIEGREPWWMEPHEVLGVEPLEFASFTPRGVDSLVALRMRGGT